MFSSRPVMSCWQHFLVKREECLLRSISIEQTDAVLAVVTVLDWFVDEEELATKGLVKAWFVLDADPWVTTRSNLVQAGS